MTDQLISIDLTPGEASMLSLLARIGVIATTMDVEQATGDMKHLLRLIKVDPDSMKSLAKKMKGFEALIVDAIILDLEEAIEEASL